MRTRRAVDEAPTTSAVVFPRPRTSSAMRLGLSVVAASLGLSAMALAQDPGPPPAPPPGFEQQPPAGYGAPPPGYYPPGYGYPAQGAMLGPKEMEYEEGDPVPPGYHVETKIRKGLVIGGAVTFGSLYLLSAATAAAIDDVSTENDYVPLYIPGIGPFITIGTARSSGIGTFTLIINGIAQTGGIAMAIAGLALPRTSLVRNDIGSVQLAPVMVGDGTMGIGFVGTM